MTTAEGLLQAGTFAHDALFYQGGDEYAREVCSFVRQGVSAGEPVLVAVPGPRLDLVGGQPLPGPPAGARSTAFGEQDLPALREQVSRRAVQEGISPSRAQDLVIAVHEIAANTVVHAGGAGILRIWRDGLSLVCEITDD